MINEFNMSMSHLLKPDTLNPPFLKWRWLAATAHISHRRQVTSSSEMSEKT